MRSLKELETTSNSSLHKRLYKLKLTNLYCLCSYCPPHSGENARGRNYKYPIKKEFQLRRLGKKIYHA